MDNQPSRVGRDDDAAEHLNDAWNEIVAGGFPVRGNLSKDLAQGLSQLRRFEFTPPMRRVDVTALRNLLMNDAIVPVSQNGQSSVHSIPIRLQMEAMQSVAPFRGRVARVPHTLAAVIATALLIAITLGGGYFAFILDGSGNDGPNSFVAAGSPSAPVPTATPPFADDEVIDPRIRTVAWVRIPTTFFPSDLLTAKTARLEDWRVMPGSSLELLDTTAAASPGIAIDFVLGGAYSATFSSPVQVAHQQPSGKIINEEIPAGTVVELGEGDAVAYRLDRGRTLTNAFSTTDLWFKRAVFPIQADSLTAVDSTGVVVTVEATDQVAMALGEQVPVAVGLQLYELGAGESLELNPNEALFRPEALPADAGTFLEGYLVFTSPAMG